MIALIDGDIPVYSVGFFNDITYYTVNGKGHIQYKKDAKIEAKAKGVDESLIVKHHEPNDLRKSLDGIDWQIAEILKGVGTEEYEIYLTGTGNYRERVAVTAHYKGTRSAVKPFWYKEMREYMVEAYDAQIVDGYEADDALGMRQCEDTEEDTVICSIDKDLRMIPGKHYNWKKGVADQVTYKEGQRNLWMQMLTGDSTDNIIGIKGVGPKTAEKLLPTHLEMYQWRDVVIREYRKAFGSSRDSRFEENFKLLYICQHEDDIIRGSV